MKQLIVLAAVIPVMLAFLLQFTLAQIHYSRSIRLEEVVHNARIEAEWSGGISVETRRALAAKIADIYDVAPEDVVMEFAAASGRSRRMISYKIGVPVTKIIAANRLFGIKDRDNRGYYIIEGEIPNLSEYLATHGADEPTPGSDGAGSEQDYVAPEPDRDFS